MQKIQVVRVQNERGQTANDEFISYQLCDLVLPNQKNCGSDDYIVQDGERLFSHSYILDTYRKIMGRTLTIIDASIIDHRHNKAVKDLLRGVFSDEMEASANFAWSKKAMARFEAQMPEDLSEIETVTTEEALGVKS